jgi:hypothetical protein
MPELHVVTGLIEKRREIAAELNAAYEDLRKLMIDLDDLDAAIRIFKPDIELEVIRPKALPSKHPAFKGEMTRMVFDLLRRAKNPLTTHEVTMHVMAERHLNTTDERMRRTIHKRVGACLKHHRNQARLKSVKGPGSFMVWEVAP